MDNMVFVSWLAGIELLNPIQRGRAYQALALAEADDASGCADRVIDLASPKAAGTVPDAPAGASVSNAPGDNIDDMLAKLGGIGSPTLAVLIAVRIMFIAGVMTAASPATAARTAGRHSIR